MMVPYNVLRINMMEYRYTESDLNTNLSELAHEVIRELYIAAKKVSVYSVSHPLTQKAVGRPFILMEKIFRFKRYFNLHLAGGHLYALNIRLKSSIFADQIMDYLQTLDIRDILFEYGISVTNLSLFLERFVKRLPTTDYQNLMSSHLEKHKISAILINNPAGDNLFEKGQKFQGDIVADFSVRSILGTIIGSDFEKLADMLVNDNLAPDQYLFRFNHDYYPKLAGHLIPEKIASMDAGMLSEILTDRTGKSLACNDDSERRAEAEKARNLINALNYHPEREEIISRLGNALSGTGVPRDSYSEILPPASTIKIESLEKVDKFLQSAFDPGHTEFSPGDFQEHFGRLLRTGQMGKAKAVVTFLIEHLAGSDLGLRKNALALLEIALQSHGNLTGTSLIEHFIAKLEEYLAAEKETFEFSDLIWNVSLVCFAEKKYEYLSALCMVLSKKCNRKDGVVTYGSFAVKKVINELNRREVINQLVWELVEGRHADFQHIKNVLVTIGSEEVALALASIISHESRQVRQYALKILSELGKSSLNVFTRIMEDNSNFEREANRRELPDARWYVIRNSIFVLGALQDPEGCKPLRQRLTDPDTRVRRAIIGALEKIDSEQAADLLLILADDLDPEIRETAIIAIGLIGQADIAPELIDLCHKHKSEAGQIINTIGRLGGEEARKFLTGLLTDSQLQSELASNRSSRDELRLATIKALGKIGDKESLDKIKEFSESLSASQKIFFGGSRLSKAAEDILNRQDK